MVAIAAAGANRGLHVPTIALPLPKIVMVRLTNAHPGL